MGKKSAEPKTNPVSIFLSDKEKEMLDTVKKDYNISTADIVRVALYMATQDPVSFLFMKSDANDHGFLTNVSPKTMKKE